MLIDSPAVPFLSLTAGICLVGLNRVVIAKDYYEDVHDWSINVPFVLAGVKF